MPAARHRGMPAARQGDDLAELLDRLEEIVDSPVRGRLLENLAGRGDLGDRLRRLRSAMSRHVLSTGDASIDLRSKVRRLDIRTRRDGFRVLHAWDHRAHDFTEAIVPVLMIDFLERAEPPEPDERLIPSILLDYYLLHLLALCAMRVWDSDDPDAALSRISDLVEALQGGHGSGHHFVRDAETLLIYALSQFHPEEHAYDRVIDRVRSLGAGHQLRFSKVSASVLGGHLRWGFWLMYGRDVVRMRDDNEGDYPWLLYVVATLLRAYRADLAGGRPSEGRAALTSALLQGLAADPWAFGGSPPKALEPYRDEYDEVCALLREHGDQLLEGLEAHRPTKAAYAPLSLHFNFPHNVMVATVTLALLEGRPQPFPINALFEAEQELPGDGTQEDLARSLMAFSRARPDRLGGRGAMLVAYDPLSGMRSFSMTTKALRESLA